MALADHVPEIISAHYELHEWRNAIAVLAAAHPDEWRDVLDVLGDFRFKRSEVLEGGGNKSVIAKHIDEELAARGWQEKAFDITITVDEDRHPAPTHKVDCFKNRVALEIEWNNKDPFYDRDLNNFRLLHELRAIDVGVIITRSDELQDLFNRLGVGQKYGASTTHMAKLLPRIEGGGGGGCPILVFGIRLSLYEED